MNRSSTNSQQDSDSAQTHRTQSQQQDHHRCPHCSKSYRRATWLENHITTKHSTRMTQEQSELLARMSNSYRTSMSNATVLSQSFQELQQATLTRDLSNVLALLKQLLPLMECLLPILEQLDEVSPRDAPMRRSNLRNAKRYASSPDLREESETKRREFSTSISEVCASGGQNESKDYPDKAAPRLPSSEHCADSHGLQHAGSMATLSNENDFSLDRSAYSRSIPRHSYSKQTRGSQGLLSHSNTLYYQAPNDALPQQRRQWRPFQAPMTHSQSANTAQVPHEPLGWHQAPQSPSERIPRHCDHPSMWLNSAQSLLDITHPKPDAQLHCSVETHHQELDYHQSALQTLQQDSSSPHQQASQHSFPECLDDVFQDWNLPATPNQGSSDSTISAAQLMRNLDERDGHDNFSHSIF